MPKRGPLRGGSKKTDAPFSAGKRGSKTANIGSGKSTTPFSVKWDDEDLSSNDSSDDELHKKKKGKQSRGEDDDDYEEEELDADQTRNK